MLWHVVFIIMMNGGRMADLESLREALHGLEKQVAGLHPVVKDMHSNMPRIATALETLARVTERLEANTEEHQRIHYRIGENHLALENLRKDFVDLEERFESLREEHLVCVTTDSVRRAQKTSGLLARIQAKATDKVVDLIIVAVFAFAVWLVIYHLPRYPVTAPIIEKGGKP